MRQRGLIGTDHAMKALVLILLTVSTSITHPARAEKGSRDVRRILRALDKRQLTRSQLVPAGFVKVAEAAGDLNDDGLAEVALILRRPVMKRGTQGDGGFEYFDLPQYVAIFSQAQGGRFALWKFGAHHFMHSIAALISDNGVADFRISRGVLTITSDVAVSMGTWSSGGCTQKWRNGKEGLHLIGLTVMDFDRKCACGTTVDTNFSTGQRIISDDRELGEDERPVKRGMKRSKVPATPISWDDFDFDRLCTPG